MARKISTLCLAAALLFNLLVTTLALTCPTDTRPLPPRTCVQILQDSAGNFDASQQTCTNGGFTGLLTIDAAQFTNLANYARVLGNSGEFYWLGYRYVGGNLQSVGGETVDVSSPILSPDNMGMGSQEEIRDDGVCIAIGGEDGRVYRRNCSEEYPPFCHNLLQEPSAVISVSPDRTVTVGSAVTLTCTTTDADTLSWRAGRPGSTQPEMVGEQVSGGTDEISIFSFTLSDAGAYYCIGSNALGSFVSDPVVLVAAVNASGNVADPNATLTPPSGAQFGSPLSLTCAYTSSEAPVTTVQWFINDAPADVSLVQAGQDESVLTVTSFELEGYYQCFVLTESGSNGAGRVLISAEPGQPGPIEDLVMQPNSRSQLFVSWLCPETLRNHDVGLLQYEVLYHSGLEFDSGQATSIMGVVPQLLSGEESEECVVETLISGVDQATTYVVKVVGQTVGGLMGEVADVSAIATTFGAVPDVVQNLRVYRTPDDKAVFAEWKAPETTSPQGEVARFRIQYRDSEKGSFVDIFHSHVYNFLVVTNVINANSYEFPQVTPTAPVRTPPVGAIAAGVTVGVLVLVGIAAVLAAGVVCYVVKRKEKNVDLTDGGKDTVKFSELPSGDSENKD